MQQFNELGSRLLNDRFSGCARSRQLREAMDEPDIVGFFGGSLVVVPIPGGQFGHDDANHEEAHGRLNVGPVRYGESEIGTSKEEVEPHGSREGGQESGYSIANSAAATAMASLRRRILSTATSFLSTNESLPLGGPSRKAPRFRR